MNIEFLIWISMIWNPGFSRIRLFGQHTVSPAVIHRLKPGLLDVPYPDCFLNAAAGESSFHRAKRPV
jgi:hypothetical protein